MKQYKVYLGTYEQFVYTFEAKNMKEVLNQISSTWTDIYFGSWEAVPSPNCPSSAVRFYLNGNKYKPALIIEQKG